MALPVISDGENEISYNESADYSMKEISDGTFSKMSTLDLGL